MENKTIKAKKMIEDLKDAMMYCDDNDLIMVKVGDIRKMIANKIEEKLLTYTEFLEAFHYCDADVWAEEPTAVERFLEEDLKATRLENERNNKAVDNSMNKKLISKCCGSEVMVNGTSKIMCCSCKKPCEIIEQLIQKKEDYEVVKDIFGNEVEELLIEEPQPIQKEEDSKNLKFLREMKETCKKVLDSGCDRVSAEHLEKMIDDWIYELENTPTPSDTFIESKIKELKELLKCGDKNCQEGHYPVGYNEETDEVEWGGCPNCVTIDGYFPRVDPYKLENLIKSSLQEQRQSILEEIEKRERRIKESLPSLTNINKGYNQALEDIKQLLKNN